MTVDWAYLDEDDYIISRMLLTVDDWVNSVTDEQKRAGVLMNWLYGTEWGRVGGPLHIVTDDGNIEDEHFDGFLVEEIERFHKHEGITDNDVVYCKELHELFKHMTRDQRAQTIVLAETIPGDY